MVIPPYLKKGDAVALVSTARKVTKQELTPAIELLRSWGLVPVLGSSIGAQYHQFAGEDALRMIDFQNMLDNPAIKAIWCARGGYGTVRIVDGLDFSTFLKHPKWIVGYSDVTVLHSHLHNLGIASIHGQMALEIEKKSEATSITLKKVLFGQSYTIDSKVHELQNNGIAMGTLIGGNLSILYSLCGSKSAINTEGKILFLEDLDEYLYHVDRMMQNLKRNGLLDHLAGLIVGGMSVMNDNTIPFGKNAEAIIAEAVAPYDYPVCYHFPVGHLKDNRALVMGSEINLTVSKDQVLITSNNH